jgi:superfamily II DNA or RNA helicase
MEAELESIAGTSNSSKSSSSKKDVIVETLGGQVKLLTIDQVDELEGEDEDQPADVLDVSSTEVNLISDDQVRHFEKVVDSMTVSYFYIDRSATGTGKTYIALKAAQALNLSVLVICPGEAISVKWTDLLNKYDIPFEGVYTYTDLVGAEVKGVIRQPACPFLRRKKIEGKFSLAATKKQEEAGIEVNPYYVTEAYLTLIANGLLLIFDEAQALKNVSLTSVAGQTLVQPIRDQEGGNSSVGFLSATLIDKDASLPNALKVLGVINHSRLITITPSTREVNLSGLQDLINTASLFDQEATDELVNSFEVNNTTDALELAFQIFETIIYENVSPAMDAIEFTGDAFTFLMYLTVDEAGVARDSVADIKSQLNFNGFGEIDDTRKNSGDLLATLAKNQPKIELCLVSCVIRLTIDELENDSNRKVIIFAQYKETINALYDGLADYRPLALEGETKKNQRVTTINKFQSPNNTHRVIICSLTLKEAVTGIDLDDQNGDFPRSMITLPTYRATLLVQAIGRGYRISTESKDETRIYAIYKINELSMLKVYDSLLRKYTVLERVSISTNRNVPIFPKDYQIQEEVDMPDDENEYAPRQNVVEEIRRKRQAKR